MPSPRGQARDVHCISPELGLTEAWNLMRSLRVRSLAVTWDGFLVGLLTDRDLLARGTLLADGALIFGPFSVATAMSPNPLCVPPGTPISRLAELMFEGCLDALPITDARHRLLGMVTSAELLQVLAGGEALNASLPLQYSVLQHPSVAARPSA